MPKILIKSRLHSKEYKPKFKPELIFTKSKLPPNLQNSQQKLLSGNDFNVYKWA